MSRLMQFLAWCCTGAFASAMVAVWPVGGPAELLAWGLAWLVAWVALKLALRRRLAHVQAGSLGLMVALAIFALLHLSDPAPLVSLALGGACGALTGLVYLGMTRSAPIVREKSRGEQDQRFYDLCKGNDLLGLADLGRDLAKAAADQKKPEPWLLAAEAFMLAGKELQSFRVLGEARKACPAGEDRFVARLAGLQALLDLDGGLFAGLYTIARIDAGRPNDEEKLLRQAVVAQLEGAGLDRSRLEAALGKRAVELTELPALVAKAQVASEQMPESFYLTTRPLMFRMLGDLETAVRTGLVSRNESEITRAAQAVLRRCSEYPLLGSVTFQQAQVAFAEGRDQEALELATAELGRRRSAEAYHLRARIRARLGDRPAALKDYSEALNLQPKLYAAMRERSALELESGRPQAALLDFAACLDLNPYCGPTYALRGRLALEQGRRNDAFNDLSKALELATNDDERSRLNQMLLEARG